MEQAWDQKLMDRFVQECSRYIPTFIQQNMPQSKPYELQSKDAHFLMNAFVNFAAINAALIAKSIPDSFIKGNRPEFLRFVNGQCNALFNKVFTENTGLELRAATGETTNENAGV